MIVASDAVILGHLVSGPIDVLIELGLPLAIFAALWWWTSRKEKTRERRPGPAAGEKGAATEKATPKDRA